MTFSSALSVVFYESTVTRLLQAPASWLLMTVVVAIAAFVFGRRSRRGAGA